LTKSTFMLHPHHLFYDALFPSCSVFFFFHCYAAPRDLHSFPHDALPISLLGQERIDAIIHMAAFALVPESVAQPGKYVTNNVTRSEEHTSELQSRFDLVCRLLLEKKKQNNTYKLNKNKLTILNDHTNATA